jgi:hypothetical protein
MKSILQEFKQHLTEQTSNVTVLFPGGFKPITGAHLALANRYAENPSVKQVIMLVGPKERDGFTRTQSIQAFNLMNSNPKIRIQPTEFNSPIMAAYEFLFALPEDATGQFAMAASAKGDDYVRTQSFVPNVDKYKITGDKAGRKIPQGIDAVELTANTDPLAYKDGTPISSTSTREAIAQGDYTKFKLSYPGNEDAILKNVWEIFTGKMIESVFSKEWWSTQLAEDVEKLFTELKTGKRLRVFDFDDTLAKMNATIYVNHRDGSNSELNPAQFAVYEPIPGDDFDFTEFDRIIKSANPIQKNVDALKRAMQDAGAKTTILTARRVAYPVKRYLEREHGLKNIYVVALGSSDPMDKARWIEKQIQKGYDDIEFIDDSPKNVKAVDSLQQQYPDVALTAHLVEGYMDPKTAEKHKKKIEKLRKFLDKNTGKEFVYNFDTYDKTVVGVNLNEINLTEVKYTLPNFDTEWEEAIRYPEFKEMGKSKWIQIANQGDIKNYSSIKNVLSNVDLNFDKLEEPKKQRFIAALENGIIEMPIAVKFDDADYDLVAGNTRLSGLTKSGINSKIWIVDISNLSEGLLRERVVSNESLLMTEGGAGGHMAHPYDDHGLTFNEMKELIARALEGRLDIEEAVTEKTDGQNLQMTWKNGQVGFARNKGTIKTPLTTQELLDKFSEHEGAIKEAFTEAGQDLQAAFSKINPATLDKIFKNGMVFANMEILYPSSKNIISYDICHIQFHNLVEYDENANKVQTDMTGGVLVQKIIEDANAHTQNTFSFIPPQKIKLGQISDFEDQQAALFSEVDQLKTQFNLKDTDLLSEYHKAWWNDVISKQSKQLNYDIPADLLETLVDRWAFNDKSTSITALKKQIQSPEFLQWVTEFDKKDFKSYQKQNMEPFEAIFLRLGAVVLSNVSEFLAANPAKSVQEIKSDIAQVLKQVKETNDPAILSKVEYQLRRLEKLGGFEKIVPIEGIVFTFKGNTYKLTGAFAPVNQLIGILKFGR